MRYEVGDPCECLPIVLANPVEENAERGKDTLLFLRARARGKVSLILLKVGVEGDEQFWVKLNNVALCEKVNRTERKRYSQLAARTPTRLPEPVA